MKLIITDIDNFNIPIEGEYKLISPQGDIHHCIGCFGFWLVVVVMGVVNSSASGALIEDLRGYLGEKAEAVEVGFHTTMLTKGVIEEMSKTEAWVFVYPLYVDGIPGHLLSCLIQLEQARLQNPQIHIYGIVNCGFYEGVQAELSKNSAKEFLSK